MKLTDLRGILQYIPQFREKTFVISVLLQLVDEGKLHLDDPLSKFALGVTIPNAEHITIRELCEMRSGLFEAYDTPEIDPLKVTGEMTTKRRNDGLDCWSGWLFAAAA